MPPLEAIELPRVLNSAQAVGIPIALAGAIFLSLGAQFQSQGVKQMEARGAGTTGGRTLGLGQLLALARTPAWLLGMVLLGLAVLLQLTSLRFAALIVVQPLGAIALVVTAILNSRVSHVHLDRRVVRAIAACVGGIAVFVTVAALFATDDAVSSTDLATILIVLVVVIAVFGGFYAVYRTRMRPIYYVLGAGVLSGFVASMAKTVINRLLAGQFDWFTLLSFFGLVVAAAAAVYLVQTSYSVGPPDLVVAGLTVIDPIVAVIIGIVVLGEASRAPLWALVLFVVAGAVSVAGVIQLSRHHPEVARSPAA